MTPRTVKARTIRAAAASVLAVGMVCTGGAIPAHASAVDKTLYHWLKLYKVGLVPQKTFVLDVRGDGTHVSYSRAYFFGNTPYGNTRVHCNWRIDFLFYDLKGRRYKTHYGQLNQSCTPAGRSDELRNLNVRAGRMCAKIIADGRPVQNNGTGSDLRACISIHR